jgi:hypothetical protein
MKKGVSPWEGAASSTSARPRPDNDVSSPNCYTCTHMVTLTAKCTRAPVRYLEGKSSSATRSSASKPQRGHVPQASFVLSCWQRLQRVVHYSLQCKSRGGQDKNVETLYAADHGIHTECVHFIRFYFLNLSQIRTKLQTVTSNRNISGSCPNSEYHGFLSIVPGKEQG